MKTAEFFFLLFKTSLKASMSRRGAFLVESGLMIANNFIFFSIWWIFFRQFREVAGWDLTDMILLMIIGTGAYGLMQICFGGVKELSKMIVEGDLDPFMIQPKHLLLHLLMSRSLSKGWGHLMTCSLLFGLGEGITWSMLPLIVIGIVSGCLVFTAFHVIAHSLPFWMGSVEGLSKKYCDSLYLFALYPSNIYSGFLQVVMFTLIPAGIISYLPVELVRHFSWSALFVLMGSSLTFVGIAFCVFYLGLKQYESGNRFGAGRFH